MGDVPGSKGLYFTDPHDGAFIAIEAGLHGFVFDDQFVGARGGAPAASGSAGRAAARPCKLIIEDPSVPEGFYRDEGGVVRVGKVQSFAAGYIALELSTNGIR